MKTNFTLLFLFLLIFSFAYKVSAENVAPASKTQITFKENLGQVSDQNYKPRPDILFLGTDGKMVYHLKKDGISYQLSRVDSWKDVDTNAYSSRFRKKNKKEP